MGKKNGKDKTLPAHPKKPTTPPASLNPSRPGASPREFSAQAPSGSCPCRARGLRRDTKASESESGCARRGRAPSTVSLSGPGSGAPSPGPRSWDGRADPTHRVEQPRHSPIGAKPGRAAEAALKLAEPGVGFGAPRSRRGDRGHGRWDAAAAGGRLLPQ